MTTHPPLARGAGNGAPQGTRAQHVPHAPHAQHTYAPLGRPWRRRGLTLLELSIVMAVLAILGALALPSMAERLSSDRLLSAASMYAADIADARHEAARRGQPLHVQASAGPAWCWAVATHAPCACGESTPSCRLKAVAARDHPGVSLLQSEAVRLDPDGQASPVRAAVFGAGERRLQVEVSRFGRARVCDPTGNLHRVAKC